MDRDGIPDQIEVQRLQAEDNIRKEEIASKEKLEQEKLAHDAREGDKDRDNKLAVERLKVKNRPKTMAK